MILSKASASGTGETYTRRYPRSVLKSAEYELVRESVGLADRSARGKLRLLGAEAAEFLEGQVTNDVEALEPGTGCYAALLNHKGKVRADMRVLRGPDWIWLDTEPEMQAVVESTVRTYGIGRDVREEDVTESHAILSLLGPESRSALEVEPAPEEHSFVRAEYGLYVATDLGVDVICATADADAVRLALGVEPVSEEAAECLRVESGRPRLGVDFGGDTIPEEAGLNERAVSFTKGCYVGQETVARLHYKGRPNRHLRGLRLSDPVPTGTELYLGDRAVGTVGSVMVSPVHGPIALALVRREAGPGDELVARDPRVRATVVELPFAA
ncbi:MAG: folate-binding protein YgfZ [Actinobacteria bacterium]|nr:MAG: folate-binding protein YgfZ [Actinomycetota bacterium]